MFRLLIALAALPAWPQPAATRPEFDVASLKPVVLDGKDSYSANLGSVRNGILTMTNVTLADCLRVAYGMPTEDQIAGPEWVKSKSVRFDILAKAPPGTSREAAFRMLQPLLEERFQMTFHHEAREMSYLALTVAKGGSKMKAAKEPPEGVVSLHSHHIQHSHIDMTLLAYLISRFTRTRVLDRTGLEGEFEVDLAWAPEDAPPDEEVQGLGLYAAIQKQLGLKLEARKGPIDVLVVDKARQEPLAN
jgi:uncharacterized protein (TIGR03435 family)